MLASFELLKPAFTDPVTSRPLFAILRLCSSAALPDTTTFFQFAILLVDFYFNK
jgi:hypothetical protein